MSHHVVIIVIAVGPDNLPVVICTIEEYFHFSSLSSHLDCSGFHQHTLCRRGKGDRSLACQTAFAIRLSKLSPHSPQLAGSHFSASTILLIRLWRGLLSLLSFLCLFLLFSPSFIPASHPPPPPPHVSCHLLPIVSVVFSGEEIRQL